MTFIFNVLRELFYVLVILMGDGICNKIKLSYLLANKTACNGEEYFLLLQQMQAREYQDCVKKRKEKSYSILLPSNKADSASDSFLFPCLFWLRQRQEAGELP